MDTAGGLLGPKSAGPVLRGAAAIRAIFDADYYLHAYPDVAEAGLAPLTHFLDIGWAEGRKPHPLFDTDFYIDSNADVAAAGLNPLLHYVSSGAHEGRDPHPLFRSTWYRERYADVGASNPLAHYIVVGAAAGRQPNPLFDVDWYVQKNPDAAANPLSHYVENARALRLSPHPLFDAAFYLERYPDVATADMDPLAHFLRRGHLEVRDPNPLFDARWYRQGCGEIPESGLNPLLHYIAHGVHEGRSPHPLFDARWYHETYPDIGDIDPFTHYLHEGALALRRPNPLFDAEWYVSQNPDAAANPLAHYAAHGRARGLCPHPLFDPAYYLERYPDVAAAGMDPLAHYLLRGHVETRDPHPLFDAQWYAARNADLDASRLSPLAHYLRYGAKRRSSPHPLFDAPWYGETYKDVGEANPLLHYVTTGAAELRQPNPLFDAAWYVRHNPDAAANPLAHYALNGLARRLSPHPLFDAALYLERYPDVAAAGMNPLAHYLQRGHKEVRDPNAQFDAVWYAHEYPEAAKRGVAPLVDYIARGGTGATSPPPVIVSAAPEAKAPIQAQRRRCDVNPALTERLIHLLFANRHSVPENFSEKLSNYFHPSDGKRIVVYTAIFGPYDFIKEPENVDPDADYVCFTDQQHLSSDVFDIVYVDSLFENKTRSARALKLLPHIFLPGYDISLWVDGSTRIRGLTLRKLIDEKLANHDLALHAHFQRNCVYLEAKECAAQKKDDADTIMRQVEYLRQKKFPEHAGLAETAQVLRRHSPSVAAFNEEWWSFIRDHSTRDQLSFNYVATKRTLRFNLMDGCQWLDPHFKNYLHFPHDFSAIQENDLVTLIMLVRNALDMTRTSIESILKRTDYPNFKLIVVDNDSDAPTKQYLRELSTCNSNIEIITNAENLSFSKANNDATRRAQSDYLLFINNDVEIIDANWLKILMGELKAKSDLAAVGPILMYPDYTIQSAGIDIEIEGDTIKVPAKEHKDYRHSRDVDALTGGCILVRRAAHDAIGGFDERFFYGQEDIDYCLKIREAGYRMRLIAHCEAIHHESHTRRFTSRTLRNREILRTKWSKRIAGVGKIPAPKEKPVYTDLLKSKPLNYRSLDDMVRELKSKAFMIPEGIDLVVGIPRSGMVPAYVLGLMLNCPVISFDEYLKDIAPTSGDRPQNGIGQNKPHIDALFIDDSINFGNAFKRISDLHTDSYQGRPVIARYLAVYASEYWNSDSVITLARCELPRIFQWNYTNHGIAQNACYDLDGVLCVDPTDEENDDGPLYTDFVLNARPLYIPNYKIKAIVTSRLEKYRPQTQAWLKQHNVRYEQLRMLNLPSKAERLRLRAHGSFKAKVYSDLCDTFLFVESNASQAREIATLTGKPVICTADDKFYVS